MVLNCKFELCMCTDQGKRILKRFQTAEIDSIACRGLHKFSSGLLNSPYMEGM